MAGRNQQQLLMKHSYRLFVAGGEMDRSTVISGCADEFDESDVWGSPTDASDYASATSSNSNKKKKKKKPSALIGRESRNNIKKPSTAGVIRSAVDRGPSSSLPVNIPDWSKILQQEHPQNRRGDEEDDFDEGEGEEEEDKDERGMVIPPHEYLWRRRRRGSGDQAASFSVHEGIGGTLKGRDLSRLRNAIWKKTGFQD